MMEQEFNDEYWMAKAIQLAEKGKNTTTPNPNVGCVIVKNNVLVGQGFHPKAGLGHAEVYALAEAGEAALGATAYVTLEPCSHKGRTPPCAEALVSRKLARVVCAMLDPNPLVAGKGLKLLENAGIQTRTGVLEQQAEKLNLGFLKRMRTSQPYVRLKMASSLDGGTALGNGESKWITGPDARADVQHWRAQSSAIVTGIETVLADNPSLNVRTPNCQRQPDRIILDSSARAPVNAEIVQLPGSTYLIHGAQVPEQRLIELNAAGYKTVCAEQQNGRIDLTWLMNWAGQQAYNSLWIEAGATMAGSFTAAGLVDEIVLYQAPMFMGAQTRPIINTTITQLSDAWRFKTLDVRQIGQDIRWCLQPIHHDQP